MVDLLKKMKQYSTSELSDALDSCGVEGALLNIKPLSPGMKLIGPAYTVQYLPYEKKPPTFKNAANYIDAVPAQSVIVIDNGGQTNCTVWGEILTQVALRNNIMGTVVHGAVRDVEPIRATNYPLFCSAITMRSGKNRVQKVSEQTPLIINGVHINPGDIIVADDNGAFVIPKNLLEEILNKAHRIQLTETHIKNAIKSGSTLDKARSDFHYDQPWLDNKNKD